MKEMRKCSFCGRTEKDVEFMIPAPNGSANICDFCIDLCAQVMEDYNLDMDAEEIATIVTAIGNHDEGEGEAVNPIAAAIILADKSDVRRTRVRNQDMTKFDIHDRVNYSVYESDININDEKTKISLNLKIDTEISSVMNYFEIFLARMLMCKKAASALGLEFKLVINGQEII